jgi:hypothetical protein
MENKFYVYAHYIPGEDKPFYIGKGTRKRAYDKTNRNKWWCNIVKKYGLEIKFLFENLNEQEAIDKEIELIKYFGRKDMNTGCLVNLTDGGEGLSGVIVGEEARLKISKRHKGRIHSPEECRKLSESRKGMKFTDEHRKNISLAMTGKNIGELNAFYGKQHTTDTKQKMSEIRKGISLSETTRKKLSDIMRNKPKQKIICPYCNKVGFGLAMKRWHVNNCKLKPALDNSHQL